MVWRCQLYWVPPFILPLALTVVIFSGYGVFTRHNAVWTTLSDDWGISIAPWATIGVFCLLLFGWLARKQWSFHIPPIQTLDITSGTAAVVAPDQKKRGEFVKAILWILNKL